MAWPGRPPQTSSDLLRPPQTSSLAAQACLFRPPLTSLSLGLAGLLRPPQTSSDLSLSLHKLALSELKLRRSLEACPDSPSLLLSSPLLSSPLLSSLFAQPCSPSLADLAYSSLLVQPASPSLLDSLSTACFIHSLSTACLTTTLILHTNCGFACLTSLTSMVFPHRPPHSLGFVTALDTL